MAPELNDAKDPKTIASANGKVVYRSYGGGVHKREPVRWCFF